MHLVFIASDWPSRRGSEAENSCLWLLNGVNEIQRGRKCYGSSLLLAFEWRLCCRQIDGPQWRNEKYMAGFRWPPTRITLHICDAQACLLCSVGCAWTEDQRILLCALLFLHNCAYAGLRLISDQESREGMTGSQSTFHHLLFFFLLT